MVKSFDGAVTFDYVLYEMSFANVTMYMATHPYYGNDEKEEKSNKGKKTNNSGNPKKKTMQVKGLNGLINALNGNNNGGS